ncbi:MAG: cell division protein FtsZ [Bacteroidetes bacterium]|nr:cell division protein FtsZ [Bacteroidota bacterium]
MPNNFEPDLVKMAGSIIKVIGVGGGGSNAVNHMFRQGIEGVEFFVCNTDAQALIDSPVANKLQLGIQLTEGLGAGSEPEQGRKAAMESVGQITDILRNNTKMAFITAGMGGGTGTGAAPVVAKIAKELGILTVGIVTIPFEDEGPERIKQATQGVNDLRPNVDALLTICNDRIVDIYGDLPITQAFSRADDILCTAAKGIAEIITKAGMLNVDFKDVQTAMTNSGRAIMGTGIAKGTDRAEQAVQAALDSPLLDNTRIVGAKHVLVNFTYGTTEPLLSETSKVKKYLQAEAGNTAHLKMGITHDMRLGDEIAITVIATGFEVQNTLNLNPEIPVANSLPVNEVLENPYGQAPVPLMDEPEHGEEAFREILRSSNNENKRNNREKELDNMSVPAYLRRNVQLIQAPKSDNNQVARHQIGEITEENDQQIQKNKFLHDNVD